jgi:hypothetical protein
MEPTLKTYPNGTQEWRLNGNRHREDGPAVIYPDGSQEWYINDKRHREDGPAYIGCYGTQEWYINDKRHREDGPAYIGCYGTKYWYINGKHITKEINTWAKERNIDLNNMTDEDKMVLKIEIKMWK